MRSPKKALKLSEAVEGFLFFGRAKGISPDTIRIYQWTFERLKQYLDGQDLELSSLRPDDIQKFLLWLQTDYKPNRVCGDVSRLSPSSVEKAWSTLRSFYH